MLLLKYIWRNKSNEKTNIVICISDKLELDSKINYKGKSKEKFHKRPTFGFKGGEYFNFDKQKDVDRIYKYNRKKDIYEEIVKDKETGEIIHEEHGKLSEHVSHGDAKIKL